MEYTTRASNPTSEYDVIFDLELVDEEDLLYIENKITSGGYAKLNPESDYTEGVRIWHLDWKNHGDTPHEIISKLKRFSPEIYRKIRVKRLG